MLAKVLSSAVMGIDAYKVEVEVDIACGLPNFTTVGLPEAAVKESKERVKAAIKNSGYAFPDDRITINLAPADIKKEGTGFDLPIALGILAATGTIPQKVVDGYLVMGELFRPRVPRVPMFASDVNQVRASIRALLDRGVTRFYAGHGGPFPAQALRALL